MKFDYTIQNKTDKPDNVIEYENRIAVDCFDMEAKLPGWMKDFFIYLKNPLALTTRQAYLKDILFFIEYLIQETDLTNVQVPKDLPVDVFRALTARDINYYLDYMSKYFIGQGGNRILIVNNSSSLSRKRSTLSVLFKYLYRTGVLENNITDGFNPIKLPKPQPDAIKRLDVEEVEQIMKIVMNGEGLSKKELESWEKTKYRDRAILALFMTYGLRLKELQQLNLSSFNFSKGEFRIFRKRAKNVLMPINKTCEMVVKEYVERERFKDVELEPEFRDALFLSVQKTRLAERSIRELVKKYTSIVMHTDRRSAYSPHKLRATAATTLIEYGFSIFDVQNLMDHDNVSTTQLYAAHRRHAKRDLVKQYEIIDTNEKPE